MARNKGGYECEFVEKPPKAFQSECPVCLLVLREPFQITCCGYAFCRVCIERITQDKKPCPCCNSKDFDKFEDKRLKRSLYEFKIYCINQKQGCEWIGELGDLDNHLNSNPEQQKQLDGCQFMLALCRIIHTLGHPAASETECPKRPSTCEYCNKFESTHEDVVTNHWPVCGWYPMPCSNNCGKTIERQNLKIHIADICPLTIIDCDFEHAGCKVSLPRKDMPAHIKENATEHLSLHLTHYKGVIKQLEEKNEQLQEQVAQLTRDLKLHQICTPICPAEFTIDGFAQHKLDDDEWFSPPFYTHPKGYKMCLVVTANSYSEYDGTHTSVGIHLMKGEFDNQLKWPFQGHIVVELLSQADDETEVFFIAKDTAGNRVLYEEDDIADTGRYRNDFVSHAELQPKYLQNDCLKLRAAKYTETEQ